MGYMRIGKNHKITITTLVIVFCAVICAKSECYAGDFGSSRDFDRFIQESNAEAAAAGYATVDSFSPSKPNANPETQTSVQIQPAAAEQPEKKTVKTCEHVYVDEIAREPSCSENGEMVSTCNKCGDSYKTVLSKTGEHDYEESISKEAGCDTEGEKVFTCRICGETYTEEIPAAGHDYKEKVTREAGCIEDGEITYTCKRCGETYTKAVPAYGHSQTASVITKNAGMFTPGEKLTKCDICGEVLLKEEIPGRFPVTYAYILAAFVFLISLAVIFIAVNTRKKKQSIA